MKLKTFKPDKDKLKPRKGKAFGCFRNTSFTCPNCLSTLRINKEGVYECTGDKLLVWLDKFRTFDQMNEENQGKYLNSLENQERFLELYKKKDSLNCGFSSKLVDIIGQPNIEMPDPIAVKKLEKALGRELTEQELEEEFIFYTDGEQFTVEEGVDLQPFKIPRIKFPEEG